MTADEPLYVVNVNPDGVDVLHRNPTESCNTDDAKGRQTIDAETAAALERVGDIRRCQHCYSEED